MEKGISLTIHSVIIIVLAILVLAIIGFFFITGTDPLRAMKYQSAFDRGCKIHLETGRSADSILLDDLDGDGKPNTLLDACRLYFADSNLTPENCSQKCKQKFPFEFEAPSGESQPTLKGPCEKCSRNEECASGCCWKRGPGDYVCLGTKKVYDFCTAHCECGKDTGGCNLNYHECVPGSLPCK